MHKIHESKGTFDFIYQIPQILYSTIASSIINIILKQLSLSEKNILALKQENNIDKIVYYSKSIKRCLIIKFICFFILNTIFLLFFWYFISCFCAVYKNTQMILIKDTMISFWTFYAISIRIKYITRIIQNTCIKSTKER